MKEPPVATTPTPKDRATTTVLLHVPRGTHALVKMLAATTKSSINDVYCQAASAFAATQLKPAGKGTATVPVAASAGDEIERLVKLSREIQNETAPTRGKVSP
jgi:hypothetical protein